MLKFFVKATDANAQERVFCHSSEKSTEEESLANMRRTAAQSWPGSTYELSSETAWRAHRNMVRARQLENA